jgi:outer membrane protein TolC
LLLLCASASRAQTDKASVDDTGPPDPKRLPLPPDDYSPVAASTLNPGPLIEPKFPTLSSPAAVIRLEAKYNQAISLRDALQYTMDYNLPIRISRESWRYQKYQLVSQLAGFIPSFSTGYNLTGSHIQPNTNSHAKVFTAEVDYPVFQGGAVFYGSLAQYYRNRGWQRAYDVTVNDALLDTYNKYTDLQLQNALLRVRARSLRLSEYALEVSNERYKAGFSTLYNVMQARTQAGFDRTAFMEQEAATRQSALSLAYALDLPLEGNLIPADSVLRETSLIGPELTVPDLINLAFNRRPDLRQYELFRLAAARTVQASSAALYPQVSFFTDYTHANTTTSGSSGSLTDIISSATTLGSAGVFPGNIKTFQAGMNLTWSLSNMGVLSAANIISAKALSRQAMLQANQALQTVDRDVRTGYISYETSKQRAIDSAAAASASKDALKFAHVRLRSGVGSNLETIQAQRAYIGAMDIQARAITTANQAQASLLHAAGLISVDTLTDGFHGKAETPQRSK